MLMEREKELDKLYNENRALKCELENLTAIS